MKRIPRQVPATRTPRTRGAIAPDAPDSAWPEACIAARAHLAPQAAALLDRLQSERALRLERGLLSEATGIELAMQLICESASSTDATHRADRSDPA